MATYGEGEPTDNAAGLMEFISDEGVTFSEGADRLENLNYVVFGLGNRTYEHFNEIGRKLDKRLESLGAKRIGVYGEGDDDKSMEEDYLAWKDSMFEALAKECNFEEGGGSDVADFKVEELSNDSLDASKVYRGELSARALLGTKGIHDAKNPYISKVVKAKELFVEGKADRSCVHMEFDIDGSGISYQHGDHIAVWANNPENEVDRILSVLGLNEKRETVIDVESLDPTLAKVPFPTPTTYEAIFRHYLDITSVASRQTLNNLSKFAPNEQSKAELEKIGSDKNYYQTKVGNSSLRIAQVLQMVSGDDINQVKNSTVWNIPFDRVISDIPRVGPRYYSISSSPKLFPKTIHITAVVLRHRGKDGSGPYVHGLATNYISKIKQEIEGKNYDSDPNHPLYQTPIYDLKGPRGSYSNQPGTFKVPIHIRRSNFRLPTSPKIPVIMVGPGTGVAPFRSFVQERVASSEKAKEKNGEDALKDWGNIWLFYGCRNSNEDYLYKEEWPQHQEKLGEKFKLEVSLSREKFGQGGKKIYVQDLIYQNKDEIAKDILERKAYVFICGEAKGMAQEVEQVFARILSEAKGSTEAGKAEIKMMKDRSRFLLDVWS